MPLTMQRRGSPQLASFTLKTLSAAVLAASLLSTATAAGLGQLTVLSSLGQPLNAEIELTSVSRDEAGNLSAKLASVDAFRQANIEFNPALYSMRFTVEQRGTRQVIRVTSAQPMNEPFVDMLLELKGSNGRLVREYTFLLDPADLRSAQVAPSIAAPIAAPIRVPRAIVESTPVAPKAVAERGDSETVAPRRPAKSRSMDVAAGPNDDAKSYTVKRGDSLARIANQVRPNGVSLDQMLVALYRANPNAFVGENMNRMRSGQILSIPSAGVASGISNEEARGVVVTQAQDFTSYRNKLAGQISTSSPQKAPESKQTAGGSITTKVEEQKNAANEAKDKLKLSKSGIPAPAFPTKGGTSPTIEEQIAKDQAISEANARVKELEKNVAELQKILELKNKNLADQQKKAEIVAKPANVAESAKPTEKVPVLPLESKNVAVVVPSTPSPAPIASVKSSSAGEASATVPGTVLPAASTPSTATPAASAASETPIAVVKTVKPPKPPKSPVAASPSVESSFIDDLMGNALVLPGLGLILVALGALGIVSSRRKKKNQQFEDSILTDSNLKANSLFGSTGGQSVDTNNSVFNSSFAPTASHLDANEVDSVAEADVYIAYGRDAQAEEILKEALRTQPERHAVRTKLLEIYATRKDTRSFELMATELYSLTKGEGPDWAHAASMGAALDPANPLYAGAVVEPIVGSAAGLGASSVAADNFDLESLLATTQPHDLPDRTHSESMVSDHQTALQATPDPFVLPASGGSHTTHDTLEKGDIAEAHVNHAAPASAAPHDDGLDFDLAGLTLPEEATKASSSASVNAHTDDLNSLNFDMPASIVSPVAGLVSEDVKKTVDAEHHPVPPMPVISQESKSDFDFVEHGIASTAQHADLPETHAPVAHETVVAKADPLEFDLSGISLDLNPAGTTAVPLHQGDTEHDAHDTLVLEHDAMSGAPEMATKLDLALAYEEIGDKEGARELLDEVIQGGSGEQVLKAKAMLAKLS